MDIWRWIVDYTRELAADGDIRLARLLIKIPEATCDDRHAEVDAIVPEALALVRARKHRWAEVYVRHWYLQSKILHRHEVKDNLPEAVSLLAFANEADTRDCPQSVCVTQDLACTYADLDGPGYAAERLAVAAETLARIDPTWPCFDCISGEYTSALSDDGRIQETLDYIEAQKVRLAEHQIFELGGNLTRRRALTLLELGRYEEAKEQLDAWNVERDGGHRLLSKRTIYARCLTKLGLLETAFDVLPEPNEVLPTAGLYESWMHAVAELVAAGALPNSWQLGRVLARMSQKLQDNGALWATAWSALLCARLAHERGSPQVARRQIVRARAKLSELRRPELLRDDIERLAAAIDQTPPLAALDAIKVPEGDHDGENDGEPEDADAEQVRAQIRAALHSRDVEVLLEHCGDNPELDLALLEDVVEYRSEADDSTRAAGADSRWPAIRLAIFQYSGALRALGYARAAEALLRDALVRNPGDDDVLVALGQTLLAENRAADLLKVLDQHAGKSATGGEGDLLTRWLRVEALEALGEDERCRRTLRGIMAVTDATHQDHLGAASRLARVERERGAYEEALELIELVLEHAPEPSAQDWERMVLGTLLERWDVVRDSAARLGMELPGEGPIELSGGICRIQQTGADGRTQLLLAERIGPVSARILSITAATDASEQERHGDIVVFDGTPLGDDGPDGDPTASEDGSEDRNEKPYTYAALAVARRGQYTSFAIDGVYPGEDVWEELVGALLKLGCMVMQRSGDSYVLEAPADPQSHRPADEPADEPGDETDQGTPAELPGIYVYVAIPADVDEPQVHQLLADRTRSFAHPLVWETLVRRLGDTAEIARQRDIVRRYQL